MLIEAHLKEKNIADATDKRAMHFLYAFQQKHASETAKGLSVGDAKMSIRPKLVEKGEQLSVSFRIEAKKSFRNSSAYIQNWLSVLRNDVKFIVSASSKAEKAVNYILNIEA